MNIFLNKHWQEAHLKEIKDHAGARYTPKLNVRLPISEIFEGLGRTPDFYSSILEHYGKLNRAFHNAEPRQSDENILSQFRAVSDNILQLINLLSNQKQFNVCPIYWENIKACAEKAHELSHNLIEQMRKIREEKKPDPKVVNTSQGRPSEIYETEMHYLYELLKELRYFADLSMDLKASLSNKPFLLLNGSAGTGKTHLLCDLVEARISKRYPTVLLFGEHFNGRQSIWGQIGKQLKLPTRITNKKLFFEIFDEAGRKAKVRALIMIDALNESDTGYWKKNLNLLLTEIKKYPNIGIVVSIRSGFEKDVLTSRQRSSFICEEHRGFLFREWEAVSKFFKEFSILLPEIPLLLPEFQNPLFLLLFCKAFSRRAGKNTRKTKKQEIFKGHEGATYIFENFVKNSADRIARQFNLPPGKNSSGQYVIWDTIIEKIAEQMVASRKQKDRISSKKLDCIVREVYPKIDGKKFIKALERNLLITKIPRYSGTGKVRGFSFRFPFQKFSDHLIARYLLKRYIKIKKAFDKNAPIGKLIANTFDRGLIEALSIQVPEWLNGKELLDVAPWLDQSYLAQEAFIESIIWRKTNAFAFDKKGRPSATLNHINSKVIKTENGHTRLLDAFLTVASIPSHPFNAEMLHNHLFKFSMPERDRWWSTSFLHYQYGERNAVERLIEWAWLEEDRSNISDESILLISIALIWFLATPNRFLRDRTTKALVSILTNRLNIVKVLLEKFSEVNYLYILERLYAVAYGCALRSRDDKDKLKELSLLIFNKIFHDRKPPAHILLRDYARGVIETAIHSGIKLNICLSNICPPYRSVWPSKIPAGDELKQKYYPKDISKDRGYTDIWFSLMYGFGGFPADFGNYVVGSGVNHWTMHKRGQPKIPSKQEIYDKFVAGLNNSQRKLWQNTLPGVSIARVLRILKSDGREVKFGDEEIKKGRKSAEEEFKKTLTNKQLKIYHDVIIPYLASPVREDTSFDSKVAQCWIFKRVVELGWDPKLHGDFDKYVNYHQLDRSKHKAERIGKKYQWIAYHEFLAYLSDHFEFKEDRWSDKDGLYEGPWQLSVRDIDPSCILKDQSNYSPTMLPTFRKWQHKIVYDAWAKKQSHQAWIKKINDISNLHRLIDIADDKKNSWFLLEGSYEWQEKISPEFEKYSIPTRRLWFIVKSYIIKRKDSKKIFKWAKSQDFMGAWMPESHQFYNVFIGEYPWAAAFLYHNVPYYHHDGWTANLRDKKIPAKILVSNDEYVSSGSSIDCSTNESIKIKLPAKWIADKMSLRQTYLNGIFFNREGQAVTFDPSVFSLYPHKGVFINKDKLCEFLYNNKYSIFWTLVGQKDVVGGYHEKAEFTGRLQINGVYILDNKSGISGVFNTKLENFGQAKT